MDKHQGNLDDVENAEVEDHLMIVAQSLSLFPPSVLCGDESAAPLKTGEMSSQYSVNFQVS